MNPCPFKKAGKDCEQQTTMSPSQFAQLTAALERTERKVDQMHTSLFGQEGIGGLARQILQMETRQEELDERIDDLRGWRAKILGAALAVAAIAAPIAEHVFSFITGTPRTQ